MSLALSYYSLIIINSYKTVGNADMGGLVQEISEANTYSVRSWIAGHSSDVFENDLAIFCPHPDNLCEAKFEWHGLIYLAEWSAIFFLKHDSRFESRQQLSIKRESWSCRPGLAINVALTSYLPLQLLCRGGGHEETECALLWKTRILRREKHNV